MKIETIIFIGIAYLIYKDWSIQQSQQGLINTGISWLGNVGSWLGGHLDNWIGNSNNNTNWI